MLHNYFMPYRVASVDNLMYVKEDLIIPQVIGYMSLVARQQCIA